MSNIKKEDENALGKIAGDIARKIGGKTKTKKKSEKKATKEMEEYFNNLQKNMDKIFSMAEAARLRGLDPERYVEIKPAADVASRVEGLVGPPGITKIIRELEKTGKSRELIAKDVLIQILDGKIVEGTQAKLIEQAVRTAVSILTEGVLVAPTEGIASIEVKSATNENPNDGNPDGSSYLAVSFAGPIRSAGGTIAAYSVVMADIARRFFNIGEYRPTETELERYVEEINLYHDRCARLQFKPTDEQIKHIIRNCPVCISGEPTEKIEVSVFRDLARMKTNKIRGGIALVVCEGIAQKSAKVLGYTNKIGIDWKFLEALTKGVRKSKTGGFELKPNQKFLNELVAGRPIFSYSMRPGGFRLRYGRSRGVGIAGKAIHPATMYILDSFAAIGTQLKLERPGKGTVVAPCDSVMGPVVLLKNGDVLEVKTSEQAKKINDEVKEVLFLGDILVSYGDFLKSNHPLIPSGIVEEWWEKMADAKGVKYSKDIKAKDAFKISYENKLALHPIFTYFWHDVTSKELKKLAHWLIKGKIKFDWFSLKEYQLESSPEKRILELLCIPHRVDGAKIMFDSEVAYSMLSSLALIDEKNKSLSIEKFDKGFDENKSALDNICNISGILIMAKAPVYIGTRMGRPEKAKKREMTPAVHTLFPVGHMNKNRSVVRTYAKMKENEKREGRGMEVEIARLKCKSCGKINYNLTCAWCGGECKFLPACGKCGRSSNKEICPVCGGRVLYYNRRSVDLVKAVDDAKKRMHLTSLPEDVKGIKGFVSKYKIPEILDKGFVRAKHKLSVFRDGTCRFDMTDMVLTHFMPKEIRVEPRKLIELGYTHDIYGKPLRDDNQILAIKVQDVILPISGSEYFFSVTKYIDEMLVEIYQMKPMYNLKKKEDLVGQLTIGLSPHTSAGVLSRIIGFTESNVGYAHPYFHCAKRRNCDGDEDCLMMLGDALINFSRKFLPATRGGTMDAPLVLTTRIDPTEVDDEVHCMEIVTSYPLEFYESAAKITAPDEVEIKTVKDILGTYEQYEDLHFTHFENNIEDGPKKTTYVTIEKKMVKKVEAEFKLEDKLRSVDPADVAKRVLLSHFLPDMYGNLRSFSRQTFRCSDCNTKYRRVPLVGKCPKCNGKLLQTIYKGGIEKYLKPSRELTIRYNLPDYLKQRLELIQKDIDSIFFDEKKKQVGLSDFM